jgi:hypothetical protein
MLCGVWTIKVLGDYFEILKKLVTTRLLNGVNKLYKLYTTKQHNINILTTFATFTQIVLWHKRFGHLIYEVLNFFQKEKWIGCQSWQLQMTFVVVVPKENM